MEPIKYQPEPPISHGLFISGFLFLIPGTSLFVWFFSKAFSQGHFEFVILFLLFGVTIGFGGFWMQFILTFIVGMYIEIDGDIIRGRNVLKMTIGEIDLKDVEEIYVFGMIVLKTKSKKARFFLGSKYYGDAMKNIIKKSVNCKKIDKKVFEFMEKFRKESIQ